MYLGPSGVEAVGDGMVGAKVTGTLPEGCNVIITLNGIQGQEIEVKDGDFINVQVKTIGNCKCCETQRECNMPSKSLWVQKNKMDKKTIVLDQEAIRSKVKIAVDRVRKRRKN